MAPNGDPLSDAALIELTKSKDEDTCSTKIDKTAIYIYITLAMGRFP